MTPFLLLLLGLLLLVGGGALLVKGATGVATRYHVSPIIVGLTIVAFGTSAPELFVGVMAAFEGQTDLVFGNVIGSNIANLGLVLGIAAVIRPLELNGDVVRRELPLFLLATVAILVLALDPLLRGTPPVIDRSDAIMLLLLFLIFFYTTAMDVLNREQPDSLVGDMESSPMVTTSAASASDWLVIGVGFVGLFYGGQLTVTHGVEVAEIFAVSESVVGLFLVAIGTSLPELVTTIIAAIRREPDLALGNVVGSNLFNGLAVLPISTSVHTVAIPIGGATDVIVSLVFAALLIPIFWIGRARLGRRVGWLFLLGYAAYAVLRLV